VTAEKTKTRKDEYEKALAAYGQSMKIFHKGDFAKAQESLTAFMKKYPEERELMDRVRIYLSICESRLHPVKISHKSFEEHYLWGLVYLNRKDFEQAHKLLHIAHGQDPKSGKALYALAIVNHLMGRESEGMDFLEKAVGLDSEFAVLARNESDFESLLKDQRFNQITQVQ